MDTVLGVSVTPTTVGWVLADGHGADGTILDHHELKLRSGRGVRAVSTAEQVADEVLRVEALAGASDRRLRVVGVTWNDEASAEAALLLEALTDAGFDNVVPVRYLEAVETLARAIAPVIGYEQTAVCILEQEWANVVMVDAHDGETRTAVKHVRGGFDGLTSWLSGMFDRDGWRPSGVLVVGSDLDINALSWQLEKSLPVPVFAQSMAQVTVARGAALAAAASTEFTDEQLLVETAGESVPEATARPRLVLLRGRGNRVDRRGDHLRHVVVAGRGSAVGSRQRFRNDKAPGAHVDTTRRSGCRAAGRAATRAPGGSTTHVAGAAAGQPRRRTSPAARGADRTTEREGARAHTRRLRRFGLTALVFAVDRGERHRHLVDDLHRAHQKREGLDAVIRLANRGFGRHSPRVTEIVCAQVDYVLS